MLLVTRALSSDPFLRPVCRCLRAVWSDSTRSSVLLLLVRCFRERKAQRNWVLWKSCLSSQSSHIAFIKASQEELETLARRACTKLGKTAGILYTSPGWSGPWEGKATSLGCSLEEASAEQSLLKWLCWDLLSCGHTKQKSTGLSWKGRCPSGRCEDHGPQCELVKWGADMIYRHRTIRERGDKSRVPCQLIFYCAEAALLNSGRQDGDWLGWWPGVHHIYIFFYIYFRAVGSVRKP